MTFINPPGKAPKFVIHKTFYSRVLNREVGYNIYLPWGHDKCDDRYPVTYHIHGWQGNESSEIWPLESVYRHKNAIMVLLMPYPRKKIIWLHYRRLNAFLLMNLFPILTEIIRRKRIATAG